MTRYLVFLPALIAAAMIFTLVLARPRRTLSHAGADTSRTRRHATNDPLCLGTWLRNRYRRRHSAGMG